MSETYPPVYIVDDDVGVRESVASLIRSAGLKVETFASAHEFLARPRGDVPSCLVLDVKLPGLSGLDLQQELAKSDAQIPIIFLTGHGDISMSVRAMKSGALEFLTKPFDGEALLAAIRQGIARSRQLPSKRKTAASHALEEVVGTSASLKTVLNRVASVAPTESTVLILGETGTGKELVARAIHARSHRSSRPLVSVNCAAIQPSLIASELFGHEKGAFTGALQQRRGRFELAEGGTIFLDEVGDLPPETQIALLRVLQEREFERVGGNQPIRADVRVIAATNRDLQGAIAAGTFRSDLFYRLNVFPIEVPPLRERREDIPLLVEYFIRLHAGRAGKKIRGVNEKTLDLLQTYSWPGNIRELQNVIERWVIVSDTEELSVDESWLPRESIGSATVASQGPREQSLSLREHVEAVERRLIGRTMTAVGGNQSEAARRLGLSRGSLIERLKKYGPMLPDEGSR
jgi:DNA-binding NtrC family response regulator